MCKNICKKYCKYMHIVTDELRFLVVRIFDPPVFTFES